jgi:small neutral amino acid transporter SnatA (MarC family)
MPPIVSATAAPTTNGPAKLKTVAITMAWRGRAARVATSAAIALAASWIPLVAANASASAIANARPTSIQRLYGAFTKDWGGC